MPMRRKAAKAAALGPVDRNAVTGAGRALVHVRRPHLKWHRRDLEQQPDEDQRDRLRPVRVRSGRGLRIEQNAADSAQVRGAGAAVDPGHP